MLHLTASPTCEWKQISRDCADCASPESAYGLDEDPLYRCVRGSRLVVYIQKVRTGLDHLYQRTVHELMDTSQRYCTAGCQSKTACFCSHATGEWDGKLKSNRESKWYSEWQPGSYNWTTTKSSVNAEQPQLRKWPCIEAQTKSDETYFRRAPQLCASTLVVAVKRWLGSRKPLSISKKERHNWYVRKRTRLRTSSYC
jgi:hypothetical protein